jgi:hypothetical protein
MENQQNSEQEQKLEVETPSTETCHHKINILFMVHYSHLVLSMIAYTNTHTKQQIKCTRVEEERAEITD